MMLPFSTDAFSILGRDGSLKGTLTRSGVSWASAAQVANVNKSASLFMLFSSIDNANTSVERVVLELRATAADLHAVEIDAAVDELAVPPLPEGNFPPQGRDIVIGVGVPIECFHPHVGVQIRPEGGLDGSVDGAE